MVTSQGINNNQERRQAPTDCFKTAVSLGPLGLQRSSFMPDHMLNILLLCAWQHDYP